MPFIQWHYRLTSSFIHERISLTCIFTHLRKFTTGEPIRTPDLATRLTRDSGSLTPGALLSYPFTHPHHHIEEI